MDILEISKKELERIYRDEGIMAASEHFGVDPGNLYRLMDEAGIPRNLPAGKRKAKRRLKMVD